MAAAASPKNLLPLSLDSDPSRVVLAHGGDMRAPGPSQPTRPAAHAPGMSGGQGEAVSASVPGKGTGPLSLHNFPEPCNASALLREPRFQGRPSSRVPRGSQDSLQTPSCPLSTRVKRPGAPPATSALVEPRATCLSGRGGAATPAQPAAPGPKGRWLGTTGQLCSAGRWDPLAAPKRSLSCRHPSRRHRWDTRAR